MTTESTQVANVDLTPETYKSKLQICLTKAGQSIQALHDAESKLVCNEDNLETIKKFIDSCKAAEKLIDDERKLLKEPSLNEGRMIDAGAKLVSTDIAAIKLKANIPFQKLCADVEKKQREAELERQRIAGIREQMNNFKTTYAVKIADAKNSAELVSLERMINLETANKNRYQEFLPEFVEDCKAIRSLLADHKIKVRELEELEKQEQEAAKNGSDEQILEIMSKKEDLEAKIAENRVTIQEESVNQASKPTESATVILPIIPKGGRKLWKWEMVDEKAATKAGLTKVVPNADLIDEILKDKRENETEVTENGIRYFIEKRF